MTTYIDSLLSYTCTYTLQPILFVLYELIRVIINEIDTGL